MSHIHHIAQNKKNLDIRWNIIQFIREWFWKNNFIEVETPFILRLPGQEPYLSPMRVTMHNEVGLSYEGYLHTSPEYSMKKMLASGYEQIFSLGKVFRDYESFGGNHNPEFTMLEWYRANKDFYALMDDIENIGNDVITRLHDKKIMVKQIHFTRVHMRDLWQEYAGINLDDYLTHGSMLELCRMRGYTPNDDESYEDLFYRIFLNEIEPKLSTLGGIIIHHYPLPMAALSRASTTNLGYAERVEVYIDGLEIANGFSELTDPIEQKSRLEAERNYRQKIGKDTFSIDEEFVEAVGNMPPSAGIALGIDRLVQVLVGCKNINDVVPLPAHSLFE